MRSSRKVFLNVRTVMKLSLRHTKDVLNTRKRSRFGKSELRVNLLIPGLFKRCVDLAHDQLKVPKDHKPPLTAEPLSPVVSDVASSPAKYSD